MLAWLPLAHAQGNDQPVAASNGLEEIVVTARRREEKLQTVPISVQAFSGETLQKHRVEGIQDLSKLVPALTNVETKRDEEGLSIRGLNNSGASAQGQSNSVTTYFAEVPLPTGDSMGSGRYYDLDDAQVLKGPQGTLFGRNSTGGALLIGPKRPTNNFEGYAEVQFGNYGDREYQFAVNVPIVDDVLLARFAGERVRRDGFTHDVMTGQDLDSRDSWSGRGSITFRPADSFENYFVYDTYYSHSTGTSEILAYANPNFVITSLGLIPGCNTPVTLGGAGVLGGFNYGASFCSGVLPRVALFPGSVVDDAVAQQKALGIRANNGSVNGLDVSVSSGATDIATWSIDDNLTLKNIFGYREYKVLNRADGDGSALKLLDFPTPGGWNTTTAQYSEELQLQGKSLDDRLVWTVGNFALYSHAAGNENSTTVAVGSTTYTNLRPTERSEALFTQATYDLGGITPMLDGLRFTGGFRYTWDFRRLFQNQYNARGCVLGTSANGCTINLASEFHAPTWNVGLDYQLGSDTLLYATGRRGYRSGGLNTQSGGAVSPEFQPETVTDVEIGVKSDWRIMGMQARTNLSAFHSDFSNAQLSESGTLIGPTGAAQAVNAIVNAASATIQGIDLDATLIPVTGLKLTASWAYTQAKYDSVVNFFDPNDQATKRRPYPFTPLNKLVLDANYTLPLPQEWGPISVDVTWSYSTHQALAVLVDPMGNQSAYRTLDLHLAWDDIFGQPIDAQFFMTNVTDNEYRIGGFPVGTSLGFDAFVWNEPQMFGFSLKYRFGGPAETEAAPAAYAPPPTQAPAPAPRSYLVFFDFNKSDLSPQAKDIVDTAAKNASANKVTQLTVTGHTDTVGSDAYNMRLSRRRAEAVAAQLEKDGVPSSEIAIVAKGKRDLLVPTADGVREPQNRRVQIVFDGAAGS
ncbi:MAG TPA: OmpA family protein [Alphaproteobacteria bacterium]|nr:OmpA family protein [Alphaproteobacteria bacterium]